MLAAYRMWLFPYLEIAPNVTHAALHKNIPGLFFQRITTNIKSMDISQVIYTAYIDPVPRSDLENSNLKHIQDKLCQIVI